MATSQFHLRLTLIACLGVAIYLLGNNATSLWDRDEPRFAEAAREMVATGDYVVPHFHGAVRYDKPPLIYWLMAAAYRATATSTERPGTISGWSSAPSMRIFTGTRWVTLVNSPAVMSLGIRANSAAEAGAVSKT